MFVPSSLRLAAALAAALLAAQAVAAQSPARRMPPPAAFELGVRGGYDVDRGAYSLGGEVRIASGPAGALVPSVDVNLGGDSTAWQANLDLAARAGPQRIATVGAGAALAHRPFEIRGIPATPSRTKLGINVFVGIAPPASLALPITPRLEARWTGVGRYDYWMRFLLVLDVPLRRSGPPR